LKNGTPYSFAVSAQNKLGTSVEALTKSIIPQAGWSTKGVDLTPTGRDIASTTFNGKPIIVFTDAVRGTLKIATWNGLVWKKTTIDGAGGSAGRTKNKIAGHISLCTSGTGTNQKLHIFYPDSIDLDLRYAQYDGKTFTFEVVDGNGPSVQSYEIADRVRTASDVSVSNACAITSASEQVFYRDESQGILLGAVRDGKSWRYEIVDGDNLLNNRTMGDVAFHLTAKVVGTKINLAYDSILSVSNSDKSALRGEVRIATRESAFPEDWKYETLAASGGNTIVAGYDVALNLISKNLYATWLGASGISLPKPDQIQWSKVGVDLTPNVAKSDYFGVPSSPVAVDDAGLIFGCQDRLCYFNKVDQTINLISTASISDSKSTTWITLNRIKYALVASAGKLSLFKKV